MIEPSQESADALQLVWRSAITIGGAVVAFFVKRLIDEVDKKADKSEIEEMRQTMNNFMERQENYHQTNTARLDTIIMELGRKDR